MTGRPPSIAWEPLSVHGLPGTPPAVWFSPAAAPTDVLFAVPPGTPVSVRALLQAAGVDPAAVAGWTVAGQFYESAAGTNPLLDAAIPPLPDGTFAVHFAPAVRPGGPAPAPNAMTGPAPTLPNAVPTGAHPDPAEACDVPEDQAQKILAAMDADWQSVLKLERDLAAAKKQLDTLAGRLSAMNKDLGANERNSSPSNLLKEWQDARRFLRDQHSKVSRVARDYELGIVSAAGNRNHFETLYRQHVSKKQPFAGLRDAAHQFEQFRKTAQNLLTAMNSAYANGQRDGEGKARQVLAKIDAAVRKKNTQRRSKR